MTNMMIIKQQLHSKPGEAEWPLVHAAGESDDNNNNVLTSGDVDVDIGVQKVEQPLLQAHTSITDSIP